LPFFISPFLKISLSCALKANEKRIEKRLLPFIMMSEGFTENSVKNSKGSVNPYINWKDIANYEFLLPPKDQQAKLAELLWAMDEVIEREKELFEKAEISKFTFIEELLTGSTRLDYFDKPWQRYRIDKLAKYRRGSFPQPYGSREWYDDVNGSPFVQVYDIDYDLKLKKDTKAKISDKAKPMSVFVRKGTLIISLQGSIGRVAVTQYDAYVDRTILIFQEFLKEIDFNYFTYAIQRIFKIAEKTAPGGTIKTITKEALSRFEINLPSFKEQKLIGERLTLLDQTVFDVNGKIEVSQSLQKSIINQIFSTSSEAAVDK
jgi:type I restriction enzyme S subunit